MRRLLLCALAGAASLAGTACWAQSFNIDLDTFHSTRETGGGAPQASFGGAANQPGWWNLITAIGPGPMGLRDLAGNPTSVVWRAWGGWGSGGGWQNQRWVLEGVVNDDFWLLMGDAANVGPPFAPHQIMPPPPLTIYTFEGLEPGLYDVYTYAVRPIPRYVPVAVTVPGSLTENPQVSTGPLPADWRFERGLTHTFHRVRVLDGRIEVRTTGEFPYAYINGFQLVKVK